MHPKARVCVQNELVSVETVSGLLEAEILRGLLEAAGVKVELSHEAALSVYSLGVGRLARVEVMVRGEQEHLARQILAEYRSGALDTPDAPA
jgi:phosphotransferase system HPr-like phosphotransfer protein